VIEGEGTAGLAEMRRTATPDVAYRQWPLRGLEPRSDGDTEELGECRSGEAEGPVLDREGREGA